MNGFNVDFDRYHDILREKLSGLHITDIRILTKTDYLFIFAETKSILLAVSLAPTRPILSIIAIPFDYSELPRVEIAPLRHHVIKMKIDAINRLNNDLIIEFVGHKKADNFELVNYRLVFELIKNHPNFILIANEKILWAAKYHALDELRPLLSGGKYETPKLQLSRIKRDFINEALLYEQRIQDEVMNANYQPLRQALSKRIRQLENKITNLTNDLNTWTNRLIYKDVADYILTYFDASTRLDEITYEDVTYELNPAFTLSDNAKQLYKRYRKARLAKTPIEQELAKAKDELIRLIAWEQQGVPRTFYELETLRQQLIDLHVINPVNKIDRKIDINQKRPYTLISDGVGYSFGRNAIQNDYLTFSLASKDDTFFHVMNHPGAHVICHHPNPDEQMIITAASLALLLSRMESGEVSFAKVNTLKKGRQSGQVIVKKHKAIRLMTVDPYLRELIKNAKRYS
ncbi:MAG TPA: NFACT family protein [Bacilli bacterium]|nr:NFACT family protein [Bacilli bacterium]